MNSEFRHLIFKISSNNAWDICIWKLNICEIITNGTFHGFLMESLIFKHCFNVLLDLFDQQLTINNAIQLIQFYEVCDYFMTKFHDSLSLQIQYMHLNGMNVSEFIRFEKIYLILFESIGIHVCRTSFFITVKMSAN